MAKTAVIHARIEENIKAKVEKILKTLGLTTTEAVNLFLHQIIINKGLPFEVKIPNKETLKTFKNTDAGKDLHYAASVEDLFKQLEN